METFCLVLVAVILIVYFVITETLDWIGRASVIKDHFPKVPEFLERRSFRVVLLLIAIALLIRVIVDRKNPTIPLAIPAATVVNSAPSLPNPAPAPTPDKEGVTPLPKAKSARRPPSETADEIIANSPKPSIYGEDETPRQTISAPYGIAIGGGNVDHPTVNNYGQQPPRGEWKQSGPTYEEGRGYKNTVTFAVDKAVPSPQFAITCDAPCNIASSSDVRGVGYNMVMGKILSDRKVVVQFDRLAPNSTVTVVLSSPSTFTVTDVGIEQ
jgi:hypothetical protein